MSLEPVLSACGKVLRELQIEGNSFLHPHVTNSIIQNCKSVEGLFLSAMQCYESLLPLWQSVGGTLRRLKVYPPRVTGTEQSSLEIQPEMVNIIRTCEKLEDVEILPYAKYNRTVPFFVRLGPRLRIERFYKHGTCPPPNRLIEMLAAFPNVQVHAYEVTNVEKALCILGSRLLSLKLYHSSFKEREEFGVATSQFWNLEELELVLKSESRTWRNSSFRHRNRSTENWSQMSRSLVRRIRRTS